FSDWGSLAVLAAGQIGKLGEDIVEGRVGFQGTMRDLMGAAAHLLPGSPVSSNTSWWNEILRRARSLALHSSERARRRISFHQLVLLETGLPGSRCAAAPIRSRIVPWKPTRPSTMSSPSLPIWPAASTARLPQSE